MGAYYIVTDLSLRARFDLASLDAELIGAGLHGGVREFRGMWSAGYSSSVKGCRHPAEAIDHLLRIVEGLSGPARVQWNRCITRRFDIGYESYDKRRYSRWQLKGALLHRLASVNGNLVVTIYRPDESARPPLA